MSDRRPEVRRLPPLARLARRLRRQLPARGNRGDGWTRRAIATLARLRVFLGFVFGAVVFWQSTPTLPSVWTGAAVASLGEAVRIWAAGHLHKSREITASGPYRWFSHPLYLGSSVMGVGLAIASGSAVVSSLIGAYLVVALTVAAKSEEAFLRRTFGDRYDRYQSGDVDATRRFTWARVKANREHRALIGFLVAAALLAVKAVQRAQSFGG
jgi:protein-S-isoprenylcysteine O-methyltransferase Ste14